MEFKTTTQNPNFPEVNDIQPKEVLENAQNLQLIDVREPDEYTGELNHVAGSRLIPLGDLVEHIASLDKSKTTVFICRSGGRSAKATVFAKSEGFGSCFNMFGGMIQWNNEGLPVGDK